MAACDGAILLQWSQAARVAWMSVVMPGQKIEASALAMCPGGLHVGRIGMSSSGPVGR